MLKKESNWVRQLRSRAVFFSNSYPAFHKGNSWFDRFMVIRYWINDLKEFSE